MKISIIVPTHFYKYKYPAPLSMSDFPVGLAYVASALKVAGHEVVGCNPNNRYDYDSAKAMATDMITKHLAEHKPAVVCTGGICTDYAFLRDCIKLIREKAPNTLIILGGGIVGYDPKFVFEFVKLYVAAWLTGSWQLVMGLILLLMVFAAPSGIFGLIERRLVGTRA